MGYRRRRRGNTLTTKSYILVGLGVVGILLTIGAAVGFAIILFGQDEESAGTADQPTAASIEPTTDQTDALPDEMPYPEPTGKIVYTCFNGTWDNICLMNADGSGIVQLTDTAAIDFYPSLAPDSSLITFSGRRTAAYEIYLMAASGEGLLKLTDTPDSRGNYAPEISPDGTRIVYTSTLNGKQDIYTMNLDGSDPFRVTTNPTEDLDPTWSPDGTMIAFSSNRTGTNELYIINADGSNERQVTSGGDQQAGGRVDWSPDGSTLAFYAGDQGDKNVYLIPVSCADEPTPCDGDRRTQLTFGGNNKAPSWSPDGMWITFASNMDEDGDNEIFIMRPDGTDVRQLTFNDTADWQPRWSE